MTRSQVQALLGAPPGDYGPAKKLYYASFRVNSIGMFLRKGGPYVERWGADDICIMVYFADDHETVTDKELVGRFTLGYETFEDKIRRWLNLPPTERRRIELNVAEQLRSENAP